MTDGSRSHRGWIDEQELRTLRTGEAQEAAQMLGCTEADLFFLDFRDGELSRHKEAARRAFSAVLEQVEPEEVYVPFRYDGPLDHEATFEVVHDVLLRRPGSTRVYEYPIWFWQRWPWVRVPAKAPAATGRTILRDGREGLSGLRHFRSAVFIGDVLGRKAAALQCHRSQMSQPENVTDWPTLGEVAGGDFLTCFFSDFEIFRESDIGGGAPAERLE